MASLLLDNGILESDLDDIARELAPLDIHVRHYEPETSLLLPQLLELDILTELQKRHILELHHSLFELLKQEKSYLWCELQIVHPGSPNLQALIATYSRYHTHTAPEALYVLAGAGIFGFVRPDGTQVKLLVQAQDYLHIPAGVEHWFCPAALLHFKAVRHFTTVEGWIPQYTSIVNSQ